MPRPSRSVSRGSRAANKSPVKTPKKTPAKSPAAKSPARRGRKPKAAAPATPKAAATPKKAAAAAANKMDFDEGDQVMARWPGTALYFKAKVTYVREDDNEYDVQYEDGTVFTIKAKEVKSNKVAAAATKKKVTPSRSRSRGRSPGRPARKSVGASPARKAPAPAAKSPSRRGAEPTPTRASARIANAKIELSSDESDARKKRYSAIGGGSPCSFFENLNFGWVKALFMMVIGPLIVLSLHQLCNGKTCKIAVPKLSKNWRDYYNQTAALQLLAFGLLVNGLSLVFSRVRALAGREGFLVLTTILASIPACIYRKVSLKFVETNYYHYMTAAIAFAFIHSLAAFVLSRWGKRAQVNPKGNTGNPIVDFVAGREFNPSMFGLNTKLVTFRSSMCALAFLNVALVVSSIQSKSGQVNPAVILTAAFQVGYALDAMYFEDYYFYSHDAMNTGLGFSLISSYAMFPFIPTIITNFVIAYGPTLPISNLVAIALLNALGYVIFRSSENMRCEFARAPNSAASRALNSIPAVGGKKILCAGWWSIVRHPNYLGEMIVMLSWVMTAVTSAGRDNLLIYYLPVTTILILLFRCCSQNTKNKRKYGTAWNTYTERVNKNLVPYVY